MKNLILLIFLFPISLQKISVISPPDLREQFLNYEIESSISNFGNIPYGYTITGKLYQNSNAKIEDPNYSCNNLDKYITIDSQDPSEISGTSNNSPIILIHEGQCSFVQMVRNVQKIGGRVAIIITSTYLQGSELSRMFMPDDGTSKDIHIPSLLISKKDGETILNFISYNDYYESVPIYLEIKFETKKSDVINVDFFLEPSNLSGYNLIKEFYPYYQLIKNNIVFNPHFIVHKILFFSLDDENNNCVSRGRYCLQSQIGKGKEIIMESLFQKCLYNITNSNPNKNNKKYNPDLFFKFSEYYYNNCKGEDAFEKKCGMDFLEKQGITFEEINSCVLDSFSHSKSEPDFIEKNNLVLQSEYEYMKKMIVREAPTIVINSGKLYGHMNGLNLFNTICNSFNTKPHNCAVYSNKLHKKDNKIGWGLILVIIIIIIFVNFFIFMICRKYIIKRVNSRLQVNELDMDGKINSVVSNYFAIKDKS